MYLVESNDCSEKAEEKRTFDHWDWCEVCGVRLRSESRLVAEIDCPEGVVLCKACREEALAHFIDINT